jgi:hypothetical protein
VPLQFKKRWSPGVKYIHSGGALWRIVAKESLFVEIEVVTTGLSSFSGLTSSNSAIVKHIYPKSGSPASGGQVFEFYALHAGHIQLEATYDDKPYHIDVDVESRRPCKTVLKLLGSTLAVMPAVNPPDKINMPKLIVPASWKPADILSDIAKRGHLDHLVFSCEFNKGNMELGLGIPDTAAGLFSTLSGKVRTIWLTGCAMLFHAPQFVHDVATNADCNVVGAMFGVKAMSMTGVNEIESLTPFTCEVCKPGLANTISESDFFFDRSKNKFKIARINSDAIGR